MVHADTSAPSTPSNVNERSNTSEDKEGDIESSLEVLILLKKSMLEKQWELSFNHVKTTTCPEENSRVVEVSRSGVSARQRRANAKRKIHDNDASKIYMDKHKQHSFVVNRELPYTSITSNARGTPRDALLSHSEVVHLSRKIRIGISIEEHRIKLKERLGFEPSDKQLASSMKMSRDDLHSKLAESFSARQKLVMSNVRLVMSIAQKFDNMGSEMADLVQGGLMGLIRGIEKFDYSKGCRISTYVYWWIRQGVSRTLAENSRTVRVPTHLQERLGSIRRAKYRLLEKGLTPSINNIAGFLNMSTQKVRNATEAFKIVLSFDKEAFPSLNGLPGKLSIVLDYNPWHGFEDWSLKEEVNRLLLKTLDKREREILCRYHGLYMESQSWEDIGKQLGLSRERVRQVGLVAMEKLKNEARRKKLDALLRER
ncbi:hypothetical protein HPP92_022744 [Vanilla planifolia]|uniref:RNA polymerase sigma-70 domain-containing protein n=1 Tax=Vanilla planifolia TaxID=51239 RepID=A0A835PX44_VANPL|nr:hypothetical protein HPP92_022744 [Vanilla planifolia]